jgi:hypothetical protein
VAYTETILAVITGIGLSAASGFRIFLPFLALNLASLWGYVGLAPGFEWISGYYATIALASATALEITAYYVPWLDNVMDAIASPVSIIAGAILTASMVTDIPPSLKWMISIIAGGGIAGLLQGATVALRLKSSLVTGGIGNAVIATIECAAAMILSFLAVIVPIIGFIIAVTIAVYLLCMAGYHFIRKMKPGA